LPPALSPAARPASATNPFAAESGSSSQSGNSNYSNGSGGGPLNTNSSERFSAQQQQQQQLPPAVDTQTSRNALRVAMQTREIGAATMNELSYQAEVIDIIERDVENIHNNLDKANRLVRGMESIGGSISNAFTNEKKTGRDVNFVDRTLVSKRVDMPADVIILWKLSNDSLVPALLRFTGDHVTAIDTAPKKTEKDFQFLYESVDSLAVRARPLHLDFRFKDKRAPRFRLMSSYIQSIVNEFTLRAKSKVGEVPVIFEPGTRKFVYGKSIIPPPSAASGERKAGGGLFRKDNNVALPSVFKNASDDIKQGVLQQEQDLQDISNILGDLHGMATTMGSEIDRQTEQLDRVTVWVY